MGDDTEVKEVEETIVCLPLGALPERLRKLVESFEESKSKNETSVTYAICLKKHCSTERLVEFCIELLDMEGLSRFYDDMGIHGHYGEKNTYGVLPAEEIKRHVKIASGALLQSARNWTTDSFHHGTIIGFTLPKPDPSDWTVTITVGLATIVVACSGLGINIYVTQLCKYLEPLEDTEAGKE